jgi:hypothetical protein
MRAGVGTTIERAGWSLLQDLVLSWELVEGIAFTGRCTLHRAGRRSTRLAPHGYRNKTLRAEPAHKCYRRIFAPRNNYALSTAAGGTKASGVSSSACPRCILLLLLAVTAVGRHSRTLVKMTNAMLQANSRLHSTQRRS